MSGEGLTRALGALLSPRGARARLAVFTYHQVLERTDALRRGEPTAEQFRSDVATIAAVFNVLPLPDAVRRLRAGTLPVRAACITFDDGYANNQEIAAPILEQAGVPATFFITGGAVDTGIMWNDLVIEAVARRRGALQLGSLGTAGEAQGDGAEPDGKLVLRVLERLKFLPLAERCHAAERIYRDNVAGDVPRLMMSRAMVADLAHRGFDVGGHTLAHPILKVLSDADARAEIEGCAHWLREVIGTTPVSFAYPNGRPGRDFAPVHGEMAAAAGFELAVSTEWRVARRATDAYSIPRIGPWWRLQRSLPDGFLRVYAESYARR